MGEKSFLNNNPKWEYIIIHHSATKDGPTVSWAAIRKYHMEFMGMSDIGYHFGCELMPDGKYHILTGRPLNQSGAHCKDEGMNKKSLGFCFIGNYDEIEPTSAMLTKAAQYISGLMSVFNIIPANVRAHRDYATYKSCPGRRFDMTILRDLLR